VESKFLNMEQVLDLLQKSMQKKKSFSMVRLGDASNLILAQDTIINTKELPKLAYVKFYNKRKDTGIVMPNLKARDLMLASLRKATVVGVFPYNDDRIVSPKWMKRSLTDKVFNVYNIKPDYLCDVCINREMPAQPGFWDILKEKRLLLISRNSKKFIKILEGEVYAPFKIRIAGAISLRDFSEIDSTLTKVKKFTFDCVLLSAGVNANIIGPLIAEGYKTTVINFGNSMQFMIMGKTGLGKQSYYQKKTKAEVYLF
jgi:hypothetical protein